MQHSVDTWFLIAEFDRLDSHHSRAPRLRSGLGHARLVTHDDVLTELPMFFTETGRWNRMRAAHGVRRLALTSGTDVLEADGDLCIGARALHEACPDKKYFLVDCMSMTPMKPRGITHVLTNDHHVAPEGFVVLRDAS